MNVIVLADTAYGDIVLSALTAGATTFISKDVTEEHLLHIVGGLAQDDPLIEASPP